MRSSRAIPDFRNRARMERATLRAANALDRERMAPIGVACGSAAFGGREIRYRAVIPAGVDPRGKTLGEMGARFFRHEAGCAPVEVPSMAEDIHALMQAAS